MRILAVGDIVGESGVRKLKEELPRIKREENIDFVITNGENSAGGMGINERNFNDMLSAGTNVVTMGNHTWGKKDIFKFIDHPQLLRPANYPKGVVGKGLAIDIVKAFLGAEFEGDRHIRRINKITEIEKKYSK